MLQRMIGPIITASGAAILLASLFANVIGQFAAGQSLGLGRDPGFGGQQTLGTIVGTAVLIVGVWLWRQGAKAKLGAVHLGVVAVVAVAMIGGPIYLVLSGSQRESVAIEVCVDVESVPTTAGGRGEKRVNYGVRITNLGKPTAYVDSVILLALRNSAGSQLPESGITPLDDIMVSPLQVDSVAFTAGTRHNWSVKTGSESRRTRSIIVPVAELRYLYSFRGIVFFQHRDPSQPRIAYSAVSWIDSFPRQCL